MPSPSGSHIIRTSAFQEATLIRHISCRIAITEFFVSVAVSLVAIPCVGVVLYKTADVRIVEDGFGVLVPLSSQ